MSLLKEYFKDNEKLIEKVELAAVNTLELYKDKEILESINDDALIKLLDMSRAVYDYIDKDRLKELLYKNKTIINNFNFKILTRFDNDFLVFILKSEFDGKMSLSDLNIIDILDILLGRCKYKFANTDKTELNDVIYRVIFERDISFLIKVLNRTTMEPYPYIDNLFMSLRLCITKSPSVYPYTFNNDMKTILDLYQHLFPLDTLKYAINFYNERIINDETLKKYIPKKIEYHRWYPIINSFDLIKVAFDRWEYSNIENFINHNEAFYLLYYFNTRGLPKRNMNLFYNKQILNICFKHNTEFKNAYMNSLSLWEKIKFRL